MLFKELKVTQLILRAYLIAKRLVATTTLNAT